MTFCNIAIVFTIRLVKVGIWTGSLFVLEEVLQTDPCCKIPPVNITGKN
jgi:hypothetical protein